MVQPSRKRANDGVPPALATATKTKHVRTSKSVQARGKYADDLEGLLFGKAEAHSSMLGRELPGPQNADGADGSLSDIIGEEIRNAAGSLRGADEDEVGEEEGANLGFFVDKKKDVAVDADVATTKGRKGKKVREKEASGRGKVSGISMAEEEGRNRSGSLWVDEEGGVREDDDDSHEEREEGEEEEDGNAAKRGFDYAAFGLEEEEEEDEDEEREAKAVDGEGEREGDQAAGSGRKTARQRAVGAGRGGGASGRGSSTEREREVVEEGLGFKDEDGAVWVDEEEEQLRVSIGSVDRLRKLRRTEDERIISAAEYQRRLRLQHAKMNPGTDWAKLPEKHGQKEMRRQGGKKLAGKQRVKGVGRQEYGDVGDEESDEEEDEEREEGEDEGDEEDGEDDTEEGSGLDVEELLRRSSSIVESKSKSGILPPGRLSVARMSDANQQEPRRSRCAIQTVDWHPNGQLLLTAGLDKRLHFFHVDGRDNPKLQTLFFEDSPVSRAAFASHGSHVVVGGNQRWYHVVDIASGHVHRVNGVFGREEASFARFEVSPDGGSTVAFLSSDGFIVLVAARTRQYIGVLKLNGTVTAAAFVPPSSTSSASAGSQLGFDDPATFNDNSATCHELVAIGGDGEVYHWDLRTMRCFHKRRDQGCVSGTAVAVSPGGRLLATGQSSGVVNLYDRQAFLQGGGGGGAGGEQGRRVGGAERYPSLLGEGVPLHSFMNLTTAVDRLAFNHDGRMLGASSSQARHALRLVHVASRTVFSNWPTPRSGLQYVNCWGFSPHSGYMAVGNAQGKVPLFRLKHYKRS